MLLLTDLVCAGRYICVSLQLVAAVCAGRRQRGAKRQRLEGGAAAAAAAAGAAEGSDDENEESEEDEGTCHSTHQRWACQGFENLPYPL